MTSSNKGGPGDPEWEAQFKPPGSLDPSDRRPPRLALRREYLYDRHNNPNRDPVVADELYESARAGIAARTVQWYVDVVRLRLADATAWWRGNRIQFNLPIDDGPENNKER